MSRVALFVLLLVAVSLPGAYSQCHPVLPSCLFDRGLLGTVMDTTFFTGAGSVVPSLSTMKRFPIAHSGDFAAVDIKNTCSFLFIDDVSQQAPFTLSDGDVQALQAFYDAGGVMVLACDEQQFYSCPAFMNQILDRLVTDVSPSVRFVNPATTINQQTCTRVTASGTTGSVLTNSGFFSTRATTISIPSTHENCIAAGDVEESCIAAQSGQIVLFGDLSPFVLNVRDAACITDESIGLLGANFGKLVFDVCASGGAGGYAHVYPFDGTQIEVIFFDDHKNYVLYAAPDFRVTISIEGLPELTLITEVGITLGDDQLLATTYNDDPAFYLNGQLVTAFDITTALGEGHIYETDNNILVKTPGPLAQFARFLSTGLKIDGVLNIVGGVHPGRGVFWNIEIKKMNEDSGLLTSANSHRRDFRLPRKFEVASLF